MPLFPHYLLTSCYILPLYRVINSPINIDLGNVMTSFLTFLSFAHIFWILKTMVKKTKFIVTLSSSTCWNLLYAILYSICLKIASGSMHRLSLCLTPSCETSLFRACRLYWLSWWLTSIIQLPCFKTTATRRTDFASLWFISGTFDDVSARCFVVLTSYTVHVLSHRTNLIVFFRIVMKTFHMERVGSITRTLFFMEVVVPD